MRPCHVFLRGKALPRDYSASAVTARRVGGHPKVKAAYTHFTHQRAMKPLRLLTLPTTLPPVLYNKMDQLMLLETALAHRRVDNQVSVTLSQLSLGMLNAEDYLEKHLLGKDIRPSVYQLWTHEEHGIRNHQHVLSTLTTQHVVPLCSLISFDFERGKMDLQQAEIVFSELLDSSVGHAPTVHRELFNQMVRCYALADDVERATLAIEEMQRRGIRRSFITYAPLYRLLRQKDDVEGMIKLQAFVRKNEGGALVKFVYIDIPRFIHPAWVAIRFNWILITVVFCLLFVASITRVLHRSGAL